MKTMKHVIALLVLVLCVSVIADPSAPSEKKDSSGKFQRMHQSFLERGKKPAELLFLGDSITEGWGRAPEVWKKHYGKFDPANFGIGGDRTEHVLWRIEQGELNNIKPKVVVLMIGTNNTGSDTAADIAAADRKIVEQIHAKIPSTKVLLLGVFPRGPRPEKGGKAPSAAAIEDAKKRMEKIKAINAELAKLDNGKSVRYLDISEKFLVDGKIPMDVMPDQLHPNEKGYQIWAEAMDPLLKEMMK